MINNALTRFASSITTACRITVLSIVAGVVPVGGIYGQESTGEPNIIVIFADDLGYGDLGSYGHPTIKTPNLDRMAREGQRWTNFYSADNVCSPSRAALLTGRLPIRNGMTTNGRRVFFPDSDGGLPPSEISIAKLLKSKDYRTAAIGKWHLGHLPQYLPTNHGFDYYFGIPYSNDMDRVDSISHFEASTNPVVEYFNVPLMRNEEIIERPADQTTITRRYVEETIAFIDEHKDDPFFVYLAHTMPHVPLFASEEFDGRSERGRYGDVVEEIDWGVGEIIRKLEEEDLAERTLVVFTSDNGPWVVLQEHGGSAGLLFGAKATSYEGGMRVPCIFWWPGHIQPDVVTGIGSTLDLLPTISSLTDVPIPEDRVYDGYDLTSVLVDGAPSPREEMFYYHGTRLFGARQGDYKLYYYANNPMGYPEELEELESVQLYNLQHDPSERFDLADEHPDIIDEIQATVDAHLDTVTPVESELDKVIGQ